MSLSDHSVRALLDAFRSPEPSPGGGSASALAGAVGAALLAMVAGLRRVATSATAERELRDARGAAESLSEALRALVDRDCDAYASVVAAYKLPKETEDEKQHRSARIQEALSGAIEAPLEVMRRCAAAIAIASPVAEHGNRNASSDVRVALELLQAGLRGALANVEINLQTLKDPRRVIAVHEETARLAAAATREAGEALQRL